MKLWRYIQGFRKGKEAHRLELESMKDPFLAEAMDGYQTVRGNHAKQIKSLKRKIQSGTTKKPNRLRPFSIAASILIIIGVGSYFLLKETAFQAETTIAYEDLQITPQLAPPAIPQEVKSKALAINNTPAPAAATAPPHPSVVQEDALAIVEDSEAYSIDAEEEVEVQRIRPTAMRKVSPQAFDDFSLPETQSVPVDGMQKFEEYIKENIKLPADKACKDVKGKVELAFFINEEGRPHNITIRKSLCPSADSEAIRLITDGPNWVPSEIEVTLDINFQ